jgi:outer membrane protein assembly factor BamE (lipoprotein component of BamABCDE complex)
MEHSNNGKFGRYTFTWKVKTMLKKVLVLAATAFFLSACSTSANRLAQISPGMTKVDVISVLGNPESVSGQGYTEVFTYTLSNSWNAPVWNTKYHVYFNDGKVVRYGN